MTQRLVDGAPAPADGATIVVGALDSYEARCRACHELAEPDRQLVGVDCRATAERRDRTHADGGTQVA
jgi:hypothetical protein